MRDLNARIAATGLKHAQLSYGRLSYRDVGVGPVIVCLHGIGSASASWLGQLESLADEYRVLAWDAPGYGESDELAAECPSAGDYAEVLSNWLDVLCVSEFHLVSHSLGALMSLAFGQLDRRRVKSLVYLDATLGYGALSEEERVSRVNQRIAMFEELGPEGMAEKRGAALLSKAPSDESLALVKWSMSRLRRTGYIQAIRMLATTDGLSLLTDGGQPVLVACGKEDRVTPESLSRLLASQFANSEYEAIDHAGHVSHIERPDKVNSLISNHVQTVEARQESTTKEGGA